MIEAAVVAISAIAQKLSEPLIQEAVFLYGVRDDVEWIESELGRMQSFLQYAENKQNGDQRVKNWVKDVRDIAYDAEDVVDTFVFKVAPLMRVGFASSLKKYACIFIKLIDRHEVGSKIEQIKSKIRTISDSRITYGIENIGHGEGTSLSSERYQDWKVTPPRVQEADFVGLETDLEKLVSQLIKGEPRRCVVSIVGMGGLGKTTLAQKIYNSDVVKKYFHSHAWITISQEYSLRELLQAIIKNCMVLSEEEQKKAENMNVAELKCKIFGHLQEKRYLMVLDDIWNNDAWDALEDTFPDAGNGSRILLTTRNKDVALYADATVSLHELRLLTEDESWELFCRKTRRGRDISCIPHLQRLGREILGKCGGLPLAIVVIGSLLSRKEPREWGNVLKSISWQFSGEIQTARILALSYYDLPSYLKPCFLYVGNFPGDFEFSAKKLIRLWVAEGFLQQRGDETLEEVGEDCLVELMQRSMIQAVKRSSNGGIKTCRIHDLLQNLSVSKAKEANFYEVHHGNEDATPATRVRRLVVHHPVSQYTGLNHCTPQLRSLLFSSHDKTIEKKQTKLIFGGFKLLRVLNLHDVHIKELPSEIGGMVLLRYLGCTWTSLKKLPPSIGNLCNLQTLHVTSEHYIVHIPSSIGKMQQLRHLHVGQRLAFGKLYGLNKIDGQPQLDQLSNLQTLKLVGANNWVCSCLGKLKNLRKLGIRLDLKLNMKLLHDSLVKLDCLQSLWVGSAGGAAKIPAIFPLTNHHKLSKLYFHGNLEKLPELREFPVNLTKLTLESCHLDQDPLMILEKLISLRILRLLYDSYVGKKMSCSAEGFPQLRSLWVSRLGQLEEWRLEEGSLPSLLHLQISCCQNLRMLPEGLQYVTALRTMELWNITEEFRDRLRENEGEDWHKIQNIPSINIHIRKY